MSKSMRIVVIALLLFGLIAASVGAQAGSWVSGIQLVNLSLSNPANVTVTFYWAEGTANAGQVAHSFTVTIAAGKSLSVYVPQDALTAGLPEGFIGAAVVSSDQPVAASINTQLPAGSGASASDPNRVGTASGVLLPSEVLYFPQVMKNFWGWNSYFSVQNATSTAVTVTATYYSDTGAAVTTDTQTISAFSNYIFRQADNAALSDGVYSASVTGGAGSGLAGLCNFFNAGTEAASSQFHSYNGFPMGATTVYVPRVVKDYFGFQSGFSVQNVGTAAATVSAAYNFGGTTYNMTSPSLNPNQSWVLYLGDGGPAELAGVPANSAGSLVLTSAQPIVAMVNEDNRSLGFGSTYNGVPSEDASTTAVAPQVVSQFWGFSGGVQVMNASGASVLMTATYSMDQRSDVTVTANVDAGAVWEMFAPDVLAGQGASALDFNGSVVVTANGEVVGIYNLAYLSPGVDARYPVNYGDSMTTNNTIQRS